MLRITGFHVHDSLNRQTIMMKTEQRLLGVGQGERVATKKSKWELLGEMELFCILTVVMVIQKYTCIKTHRTVHIPKSQFYHMKII